MYNQRQHFKIAKKSIQKDSRTSQDVCEKINIFTSQLLIKTKKNLLRSSSIFCAFPLTISLLIAGCDSAPKETAQATSKRRGGATAVDTAIAKKAQLDKQISYIGTTLPYRKISVRSQIEGQLLALNVDVGVMVSKGYIIGLIDDSLLNSSLNQAEAELAALNSEVARANTQVSNALTEVERARLQLQQAQSDAQRQQKLLSEGAIAQQIAEQSRTEAQTAAKALRLAEKRVQTERQAVAAAKGRVVAQQAVVAQAKERKSYAKLTSPIAGVVLEKIIEPGNLVQPGNEIIKIGDFSKVKIEIQVSELELGKLEVGQSVEVLLDAFPNQEYIGTLKRISPAANSTARLIPVEVVIPNVENKIGSGLLARANFQNTANQQIVVPFRAIQTEDKLGSNLQGKIFTVVEDGNKNKVKVRSVTLGKKADGKVEILSGLQPGESYVVRSSKPLKDGENVRLSILSETVNSEQ
ncbi:RND family efflux transporter, MFP subunit [Rivularia sp. PCC 7116]|uniref:efflux RND transporter periplasmic adaptor subunit n=1 Tax=Rivularia sp. PCC 7116 TaxID=373994 RepID=UPI00029EF815|nr:efflux RND transporter periplasmic adaptor subunit [Rivularia sp. PCC 7116]AFY53413.1 RND family efflux transporter, MFP subunit [Rivularia sp. PCC 7116]